MNTVNKSISAPLDYIIINKKIGFLTIYFLDRFKIQKQEMDFGKTYEPFNRMRDTGIRSYKKSWYLEKGANNHFASTDTDRTNKWNTGIKFLCQQLSRFGSKY